MRSRTDDDRVLEVTRRRMAALTAELAAARGEPFPAAEDVSSPEPAAPTPSVTSVGSLGGRHARRAQPRPGRVWGRLADRLPVLPAARTHLGAGQAGLVLVIVAAGLVLTAWWLVRAGGVGGAPGEVAPPRQVAGPSAAPADTPAVTPGATDQGGSGAAGVGASPTAANKIVVDVVGKVRHPGIAVLPAGSRVVDAVRAAGGMRPGVPPGSVNMARPLTDGEQVLVGVRGSGAPPGVVAPSPGATTGPSGLVNLNTADQTTLETLPGVGPVTAQAILEWRTEHGGFTSVDELLEVSGIGDATLAEIAPHVTV